MSCDHLLYPPTRWEPAEYCPYQADDTGYCEYHQPADPDNDYDTWREATRA